MTPEHTSELCRLWRDSHDEGAIAELIVAHRNLVGFVLNKYFGGAHGLSTWIDPEDLRAVGERAIVRTAETHNPERACFVTYCVLRIKGAISRELSKARGVKRTMEIVSLDADENRSLHETIAAAPGQDAGIADEVETLLATLSFEAQQILRWYYLWGHSDRTISTMLGISKQAANLRRHTALRKLRHPSRLRLVGRSNSLHTLSNGEH